jgi:H+/Cl- antiporter ClcA
MLMALEGASIGAAAAFVICSFRILRDKAAPYIMLWLSDWRELWWKPIIWLIVLIVAARFLGWLVRKIPLISGSGIPQTELVIMGKLHISRMDWLKVLIAKFVACLVGMLGGLSLGRAAPCIQMGAATAALVNALWEHFSVSGRIAISAGAAAGLTAAFGAPIAGFLFVFEEMHTKKTRMGILIILASVLTAQIVTSQFFGLDTLFPFELFLMPEVIQHLWLIPVMGVAMGAAGVFYSRSLIAIKNAEALHTPLSQDWRILPPMLAAFILMFTFPSVLGGGDELIASLALLAPTPETILKLLFLTIVLKTSFAIFSYTGNVPGGILMPILCIGALLGALCGQLLLALGLLGVQAWQMCIIYGMAGFFTAVIRTPLTGAAVAMEISGSLTCLPGSAAIAFLAAWTADQLNTPPIYDSMRAAIVIRRR